MTFSEEVKKECARLNIDKACCSHAELVAFLRLSGTLELGRNGRLGLSLQTENPATARRIFKLLKKALSEHHPAADSIGAQVFIRRKTRLKKNHTYLVSILPSIIIHDLLVVLGMMREDKSIIPGINAQSVRKRCCQYAYLRGAFMASGAVSDPKKGQYHCEILAKDELHAVDLLKLLNKQTLGFKLLHRKVGDVAYLKDSQRITEFLIMIGAHSAALQYESARVYRGLRNQVNRLVNSETANLNKTVTAAWRQIENIKHVKQSIGIDGLPPNLRRVAEARLNNPELSLQELANIMDEDLSKSAVNHRLRKIEQIVTRLKSKGGKAP